jgi:hypothetical protein
MCEENKGNGVTRKLMKCALKKNRRFGCCARKEETEM